MASQSISVYLNTALKPTLEMAEAAWKRVMILNATQVLYTFTYDAATERFSAHKR